MKKFLKPGDRDALIFGIFDAFRDVIEINGEKQDLEAMHRRGLWLAVLEGVRASKRIVLHPSISSQQDLLEIIISFRIETQSDVSIYRVRVGGHALCTAI